MTPVRAAHLGPDRRSASWPRRVFLAYVFVLGRRAVRRGDTGDLDAALLEDRVATQA